MEETFVENSEVEGTTLFFNNVRSVSANLGELEILIEEKSRRS